MTFHPVKIFFDGGCRPNPGPIEVAVVAFWQTHIVRDIGAGSSLDAEWLALIHALRVAQSTGASDMVLLGDSAVVVAQANGMARCRGTAIVHRQAFLALVGEGARPKVRHVKRSHNLAGIALARLHDFGGSPQPASSPQ